MTQKVPYFLLPLLEMVYDEAFLKILKCFFDFRILRTRYNMNILAYNKNLEVLEQMKISFDSGFKVYERVLTISEPDLVINI